MHEVMRPVAHLPHHPVALASFGLRALPPATVLAGALRTPAAKAALAALADLGVHDLDQEKVR